MLVRTPTEILKSSIVSTNLVMNEQLIDVIKSLYSYELFKPVMDLTTTLAHQGRLKILATPKEFYVLDNGNCVTIEGGTFDKLTNIFRTNKNYKITIKKITSDVVMHEICHMIEKECDVNLDKVFMKAVYDDISDFKSKNVSLNSAIKQIMIDEVKSYTNDHHASELFTRYFQLLAMSKEVMGYAAQYGYKLADVRNAFPSFNTWLNNFLYTSLLKRIDPQIALNSKQYITDLNDIKHEWSKQKVRSIHGQSTSTTNTKPRTKWSSSVKSMDE